VKRFVILILSLSIWWGVISVNHPAMFAQSEGADVIQIDIDGVPLVTNIPPVLEKNRTLVPLRAICEALGSTVEWVDADQSITVTKENTSISLKIGSEEALKDGTIVALDVAPYTINGRTMVPLRFISESLGAQVRWDGNTRTISITTVITSGNYTYTVIDKEAKTARLNYIKEARGAVGIPNVIDGYTIIETRNIGPYCIFVAPGSKIVNDLYVTSVTIPDSVTGIGKEAFALCEGLKEINVAAENRAYKSAGGVLFNKDETTLIKYPEGKEGTAYQIPGSVASIGDKAFYFCYGLSSVTIPDGVINIGEEAFYHCNGLTSMTIPKSVTDIGEGAFNHCTGLTGMTIPDNITSIGKEAFANCENLASVTIPYSVTSISGDMFFGCTRLSSVTIPNSVTNIGEGAFNHCTGLIRVTFSDSVTNIGKEAFANCENLASVTIPYSVTSIGEGAFHFCFNLITVYFNGNAPTDIGNDVFDGTAKGFTIFYIDDKTGWTNPWHGYKTLPFEPESK
jgi:hypothetical protein